MSTAITMLAIPDGPVRLRNPANGYEEVVDKAWLWCLLFGCFYLAYKSAWMPAVIAGLLSLMLTPFIVWPIFAFFARSLVVKSYLRRGWKLATPSTASITT